jgi:four helix bundle protein
MSLYHTNINLKMAHHNFKELKVWHKSMDLVELVYKVCGRFPNDEKYGIVSQIKRSSVSIPSNIAEGSGRGSDKEFKRFLEIALGSCNELETQLLISIRLSILLKSELDEIFKLIVEVSNMTIALINKFTASSNI